MKMIWPLLLAALASSAAVETPAAAQSARFCATQRDLGLYPPGCPPAARPRPTAPRPPARPRPPRRPASPTLSRAAIAMRDALASVSPNDWLAQSASTPVDDRIWALGTDDDMIALAETGNARAQTLTGIALADGRDGVARDPAQAIVWLRRAADRSEPRAQVVSPTVQSERSSMST